MRLRTSLFFLPILAVSLLLPGQASASSYNAEVYRDTLVDTNVTDTILYGDAFDLSTYEDIRWIIKVQDTSETGFANDSIQAVVGYQTGTVTLNSLGKPDTVWAEAPCTLSVMLDDSLGKSVAWSGQTQSGVLTALESMFDTLSVTGYAVRSVWHVPEWDHVIRPVLHILANNNPQRNIWIFECHRRVATTVRQQ